MTQNLAKLFSRKILVAEKFLERKIVNFRWQSSFPLRFSVSVGFWFFCHFMWNQWLLAWVCWSQWLEFQYISLECIGEINQKLFRLSWVRKIQNFKKISWNQNNVLSFQDISISLLKKCLWLLKKNEKITWNWKENWTYLCSHRN